ncbi:MAG: hypothetical protein KatS3mg110_2453 [Pirellulaceae bacterium]|nr:MAG: hypothetical protein KatS3mg110_2453 [Pirellulaceae bacterium]
MMDRVLVDSGRAIAVCMAGVVVGAFVLEPTESSAQDGAPPGAPQVVLQLAPGPDNPRNSEGDFLWLRGGRLMFAYSRFEGGRGDHDRAVIAARYSSDQGRRWTDSDRVLVAAEGRWNVMSVSLVRLPDGRIAMFYLRKNSLEDCRPVMRVSRDEGDTWSEARECIQDQVGYYVMNNDRAYLSSSGRLILPVALHNVPGQEKPDWNGKVMCYLSDDMGQSWRRSKSVLVAEENGRRLVAQEPGVVELKDGRLWMWVRSNAGCQLVSYSEDGGDTWSPLVRSNIISPLSPASIERIPATGDLLLVWNDHSSIPPELAGKRTPLCVAVSSDDGRTWRNQRTIAADPDGWYCYTAIEFVGNHVLLGHCAGNRKVDGGLAKTDITRFSLEWLYAE